jgi:hypothetical protein
VKRAFPVLVVGVLQRIDIGNSDLIFCVPMFVELWANDPAKVEHFKKIHGLVRLRMMVEKPFDFHLTKISGMLEHP